jgi:hypothetical protein
VTPQSFPEQVIRLSVSSSQTAPTAHLFFVIPLSNYALAWVFSCLADAAMHIGLAISLEPIFRAIHTVSNF